MTQIHPDLTAVVCTLNSENSLDSCLASLEGIVSEIIVVDGGSRDSTISIAKKYRTKILRDSGSGLGEARGLGLSQVDTRFVLNCGADNVLTIKLVERMIHRLESDPRVYGVSCQTVVEEKGYISKVSNRIWRTRFASGNSTMVGTPNIFRTEQLRRFGYSKKRGWSDDEEVCYRMSQEEGALFEILREECLETGQSTVSRQVYRFFHYGYSDFEIYSTRKKEWKLSRRIKSISHPLVVELIYPLRRLSMSDRIYCLPVMLSATFLRYLGWAYRGIKSLSTNKA